MADPNRKLRHERQLRGWSQGYVAEQIEAPNDSYISRWERGEVLPSPFYQKKLCELFGKTAEELGLLQPIDEPPPSARISRGDDGVVFPSVSRPVQIDTSVNPFTYGNPISDPTHFFGRTQEVEHVFSRLRNAEFESSSIIGERRTGKTSLLKYLAHPIVRQHYGLDPERYLFIYVDLQIVNEQTTPSRLWQRLLKLMKSCCPDPQLRQALEELTGTADIDTFALEDTFDMIDEKGYYIALLLDEFEHVTENENFNASFFYGLRSLAIHHHLALITSSRRELIELCHSQAIRSSPFFNIFATMTLGLFSSDEAHQLVRQLLGKATIGFSDPEIVSIMHLAGHHPYFLQMACSFLFDAYIKQIGSRERITFIYEAVREGARPHFASYWQSSDDHEKIMLTALALLEGGHGGRNLDMSEHQIREWMARFSQTIVHLKMRSLVTSPDTTASLFGMAFGEWIWNEITDTRRNHSQSHEWLTLDTQTADRLKGIPELTQKELGEVFSHVNDVYHPLFFQWIVDIKLLSAIIALMKELFQSGWKHLS